jgi:hypothetical protein
MTITEAATVDLVAYLHRIGVLDTQETDLSTSS